jgi:hypothetical protein
LLLLALRCGAHGYTSRVSTSKLTEWHSAQLNGPIALVTTPFLTSTPKMFKDCFTCDVTERSQWETPKHLNDSIQLWSSLNERSRSVDGNCLLRCAALRCGRVSGHAVHSAALS